MARADAAHARFQHSFQFIRRWLPLLVAGPLLIAVAAVLLLSHIPPVYEANVTLLVGQGNVTQVVAADELRGAELLARTYAELVRTRPILEEAAAQIGLTLPFKELQKRVNARLLRDTQLIRISAEDADPAVAAQLANMVSEALVARTFTTQANRFASSRDSLARLVDSLRADVEAHSVGIERLDAEPPSPARDAELARLKSELTQLQGTYSTSVRSYEELRISEARGNDTLTIMEYAALPEEPIRPQKVLWTVLAGIAGLGVAVAGALGLEYVGNRIRGRQDVLETTGLVTLGVIPQGATAPGTAAARRLMENCRLLLLNLQVATLEQPSRLLLVTSARPGDGKSTTAAGLSTALAEAGRRVILVDADLHRPSLHSRFNLARGPGLSSILVNPLQRIEPLLRPTEVSNLQVLTAGPLPADPSALFSSVRLGGRLAELAALCDVVVIDTPPVLAQPDAALVGAYTDAALMVISAGHSQGRTVAHALDALRASGVPVVGAVLNRVTRNAVDYATYGYEAQEQPQEAERGPGASAERSPRASAERSPGATAEQVIATTSPAAEMTAHAHHQELPQRFPVAGIGVSSATYASASAAIVRAAQAGRSLLVAATSVHGLTLGNLNPLFGRQLDAFDLVVPDGQPVRWALNLLHGAGLRERVYGPTLMLRTCEEAARQDLGIYLYGSRPEVLSNLVRRLPELVPDLRVSGFRSPPFRPTTAREDDDDVQHILASGARLVFVGLGCPRQEQWAYAHRDRLGLPLVCVGAAFDFHAGTLRQAPTWMQARGLEWLFRLLVEPKRLWRRYAVAIPVFVGLLALQYLDSGPGSDRHRTLV